MQGNPLICLPAFVYERLGLHVRIIEDIRKAVVYVGLEPAGSFVPLGTGFLIAVEHKEHSLAFLVTARHILQSINGDHIYVRLNRKVGDAATIRLELKKAEFSENQGDDVAILNIPYLHDGYEIRLLRLDEEAKNKELSKIGGPALGDEVFTIGLYTSHYGLTKNIPLVRVGHIAMLPDEPVRTKLGYTKAYLIETRSIAGLSGSPVYLNVFPVHHYSNGEAGILQSPAQLALGIMVGYHNISTFEDQIPISAQQGGEDDGQASNEERNTGIAVVVPIEIVYELFKKPEIISKMDHVIENYLNGAGFVYSRLIGGA